MDCIDLRERFGREFKIGHDEAFEAESPRYRAEEERWLQLILCRNGTIGPWGGAKLVAATRTAGRIAKALRALPCVRIVQDGADGVNAVFDVSDFARVAEIMLPRRRRQSRPLSEAQKAALAAYAFRPGADDRRASAELARRTAIKQRRRRLGRPRRAGVV